MTRLPPRPLLHPAIIAKNWIFCPGPGTPPALLLLLCSDVDVVRLRRGLGEGEGAAETGAKECWSSRAAQLGWRLRRPRPEIVITAPHSAAAAAAAARRGAAPPWPGATIRSWPPRWPATSTRSWCGWWWWRWLCTEYCILVYCVLCSISVFKGP